MTRLGLLTCVTAVVLCVCTTWATAADGFKAGSTDLSFSLQGASLAAAGGSFAQEPDEDLRGAP